MLTLPVVVAERDTERDVETLGVSELLTDEDADAECDADKLPVLLDVAETTTVGEREGDVLTDREARFVDDVDGDLEYDGDGDVVRDLCGVCEIVGETVGERDGRDVALLVPTRDVDGETLLEGVVVSEMRELTDADMEGDLEPLDEPEGEGVVELLCDSELLLEGVPVCDNDPEGLCEDDRTPVGEIEGEVLNERCALVLRVTRKLPLGVGVKLVVTEVLAHLDGERVSKGDAVTLDERVGEMLAEEQSVEDGEPRAKDTVPEDDGEPSRDDVAHGDVDMEEDEDAQEDATLVSERESDVETDTLPEGDGLIEREVEEEGLLVADVHAEDTRLALGNALVEEWSEGVVVRVFSVDVEGAREGLSLDEEHGEGTFERVVDTVPMKLALEAPEGLTVTVTLTL